MSIVPLTSVYNADTNQGGNSGRTGGGARGSKSPRLTYTASIETHDEIRRLKDELVSERRSKDSLIDIERGRVDSMQKQIDSLKQHMSNADARLAEAEQRVKESQRRLAVAESMIETPKLEMETAEARYLRERERCRERARNIPPRYYHRQNNA
jgi:chromosome segregation ATPase